MYTNHFKHTLISGFIILFLVLFPHFVPLPFYSYAIVCILVISGYLKNRHQSLSELGLSGRPTLHAFLVGIVSAILWIGFNKWIYHPFIIHYFKVPRYTEYDFLRNQFSRLITTVAAAWLIGGLYEEIVFRGFIQKTAERWFMHSGHSFWIAGLLNSLLFGLYHWQQGIFGVIGAVMGGLFWTYLLARYKGNLWYPIFSHALFDSIALWMIYKGIEI